METRSTEVATNVTPAQVENLPKSDRNFLALAVLAPGVRLSGDRIGDTRKTISAGAQGAEQINVFIDGASYKNDILKGGVAGQDASRGNPVRAERGAGVPGDHPELQGGVPEGVQRHHHRHHQVGQ